MVLSCIISKIKQDIGRKMQLFHTPVFIGPIRGGHQSIAILFSTEKQEWYRYQW